MKKILFVITIFIACFLLIPYKKEVTSIGSKYNIYIEENGDYVKSNSSNYPGNGYYLNTTKSECENESILSQNNDLSINMSFNKADKCNLYFDKLKVVTFDANGGEVGVQSMLVKPGGTYENLPTPTREGYTFLGWNGKNMFDEESILMAIDGATYENGYYNFTFINAHYKYGYNNNYLPIANFKNTTRYSITLVGYVDECTTSTCTEGVAGRFSLVVSYLSSDSISHHFNETEEAKRTFTTKENDSITNIKFSFGTGANTYAHIKHLQIEEGEEATEFEPYYVTNTTKVVQDKDHTLKAIWKKNE